jgi:hypothetical protein
MRRLSMLPDDEYKGVAQHRARTFFVGGDIGANTFLNHFAHIVLGHIYWSTAPNYCLPLIEAL